MGYGGDFMSEIDSEVQLVEVTKENFLEFLKKARERILIAKPGYYKEEVITLIELATKKRVKCTVYVDPDESAVRYGFGEIDALKTAKNEIAALNLQTIQGIRLSVVIVDDRALIFTPAALSWEEPRKLSYPNGLEGGKMLVDQILTQFNTVEADPNLPKNVTNFPTVTIQEIKKIVTEQSLNQTIVALEKNPPVDPAKLRKVNFYRNLYKLLKYQIRGVQVKNKTLDLRPFNKLFPESNKHLKRSWQVFSSEDIKKIPEFTGFEKAILKLIAERTIDTGRHGYLISIENKKILAELINKKKEDFMESLKKKDGPNGALMKVLSQSKEGLASYLNKEIQTTRQLPEAIFARNRILFKSFNDRECSEKEKSKIVCKIIEDFLENDLKFPEIDTIVNAIDIKLDYYDVSDEILNDDEFKKCLDEARISPREYDQGYKP